MASALAKLNANSVLQGNMNGIHALLVILDLIKKLQTTAPAFRQTECLYNKFLTEFSQFL